MLTRRREEAGIGVRGGGFRPGRAPDDRGRGNDNMAGIPGLVKGMLDEVWGFVAAAGLDRGCRRVMLYLDDVPSVEIGVELLEPCRPVGRVMVSTLPAGRAAGTVHRGPYQGLGSAHRAGDRVLCIARPSARWSALGDIRPPPGGPCRVGDRSSVLAQVTGAPGSDFDGRAPTVAVLSNTTATTSGRSARFWECVASGQDTQ